MNVFSVIAALALGSLVWDSRVEAQAPATGTLSGVVTDSTKGVPVAGARVVIESLGLRASAQMNGAYRFAGLPVGQYVVRVVAIGYLPTEFRDVAVTADQATRLNVTLVPAPARLSELSITASRSVEQSANTTASSAVMTGQRLADLGTTRVDQALNFIAGVQLNNDNNNDISIRGSSGIAEGVGSRVLMMVDGHPLLSADGGEIDFNALPFYDIEQVEVVKGAYSAAYGSNALGGVINIITTPITDRAETIMAFNYGVYNVPQQYRFTSDGLNENSFDFTHSREIGDVGLRLAVDRATSTGFRQDDFSERWAVRSKLVYPSSSSHPSTFYALYTNELGGDFTGAASDSAPYVVRSADRLDRSWYRRASVGGTIIPWANSATVLSVLPSIDYDDSHNDFFSDSNHQYHTATRYGVGVQLTTHPTETQTIVLGGDGAYTEIQSDVIGDHSLTDDGLFAQDDWDLNDVWRISFGARVDEHQSNVSSPEEAFSPKLGVRYRLNDETNLRASIGHGYRAPSAIEQFTSTFQQGVCVVPNLDLHGEQAWSEEVGVNSVLTRWASVDAAVFESDYHGLISPSHAPNLTQDACAQSPISFQFQNIERARDRGLDLSTRFAAPKDWIALQLAYLYLDTRNLDPPDVEPGLSGRQLPYRSTNNLTANLDFVSGLAGIDAKYRSRPAVVLQDPVEPRSGFVVFDARGAYRLHHTVFQIKVTNLFQERYVDILEHYFGAPRSLQLTAIQTF